MQLVFISKMNSKFFYNKNLFAFWFFVFLSFHRFYIDSFKKTYNVLKKSVLQNRRSKTT